MQHFIIDGMNVIYKDASLRRLLNQDLNLAYDSLINRVISLAALHKNNNYTLVFDGKREISHPHLPNFKLIYVSNADIKIKELINSLKSKNIIVISSDIEIHNYAKINSALPLSSSNFIDEYLNKKISRKTDSKISKQNKTEKPTGISKEEVKRMMNLFENGEGI